MEKKDIYTYLTLLILTAITAYFANNYYGIKTFSVLILILSGIKFLLVAFNFMELKKAHPFWKILLVSYLSIFITIISLLL
jgi:uncharacterized membrane-anchored protein